MGTEFIAGMQGLDKQYKIKENASALASQAVVQGGALASQAASKAQQLDEQYHIQDKAKQAASQAWEKADALAQKAGLTQSAARPAATSEVAVPDNGPIVEGVPPKQPTCFGLCG